MSDQNQTASNSKKNIKFKKDVKEANKMIQKQNTQMNKAQKLEEQKQAEKRKTLFGVRKPLSHNDIVNLQQSLGGGEKSDNLQTLGQERIDSINPSSVIGPDGFTSQIQGMPSQQGLQQGQKWYQFLIIKEKQKWKAIFDFSINLIVVYNCVVVILEICFRYENVGLLEYLDDFVEFMFVLDMLFQFFQEYKDAETQQPVREITLIAKNYVTKGSFLIDFCAVFPFSHVIDSEGGFGSVNKLLRLIRMTRIQKMLDIARFNHLLKSLFENDSSQDKIMLQYVIMHAFKIIRLFLVAILCTFVCGCLWYLIVFQFKAEEITKDGVVVQEATFFYQFEMDKMSILRRVIVSWYYSMTTLTTVGYGDYYPISNTEIFMAVVYMLCGVVFFSYIMSSVIEIINNQQKKMSLEDKTQGLRDWLTLLSRFTNKKPLPKSLYNQISQHFDYFWTYDRLAAIHQHSDTLNELPKSMKRKLMTNYLFEDIFKNFKFFFKTTQDSSREQKFLYDVSYGFLPRYFNPKVDPDDEIIYDEEDEVPEMYFCLEGLVQIGYFFESKVNTKNQFRAVKKFAQMFIICDHFVVNNMRCEFVYMCVVPIKCFALTKKFLLKNIFQKYPEIANEIKANSHMRYQKYLKRPIQDQFKQDIIKKNKKSSYKFVSFEEKGNDQRTNQDFGTKLGSNPEPSKSEKAKGATKIVNEQENLMEKNKREAKKNDLEMNTQLKKKMNGIRAEVSNFNKNIDEFSLICDNELAKLYDNVEKVSQNIGNNEKSKMDNDQNKN